MDLSRGRMLRKGDYIYGSFVKPASVDGYINGVNPGDRSDSLGRFPFSESSVDEAMDFAATGASAWRRLPIQDRAATLKRFRDQLTRFQERLARLVTRETGKPIWEARQEVLAAIRAVDLFLDIGYTLLAPRVIDEVGARSDRMPRGVVGVIAPFNFPVLLPVSHTSAALLAGNAVVFKPSKYTPGTGQAIAELWDRCRLPRGAFNMVQGPGAVIGQRIVTHPGLDALLFNGSYQTCVALRQITTERPELPAMLHCGGKGIAIVLDDAELDRAVYEVMVGAFLTAGQRHNSTGRVIVTSGIYDAFVDSLVRHTSRLTVGYGFDPESFMGPLISENLRSRYRRYARRLTSKGHQALLAAEAYDPGLRGFYASPAIYQVKWENGAPFLSDEPPGPILLIYRVESPEQAAALHNQAAFRLATSLFTRFGTPLMTELSERLLTGGLNVNRGTIGASMRLPSVGVGRSSNGVPGGLEILHLLTQPRARLVDTRPFSGASLLPGIHWDDATASEAPPLELDDTEDIEDVSSSLELAAE